MQKWRIIKAKCFNSILWFKQITEKRTFNVYKTMAKSTLLYGAETWRVIGKYKEEILLGIKLQKKMYGYYRQHDTRYNKKTIDLSTALSINRIQEK